MIAMNPPLADFDSISRIAVLRWCWPEKVAVVTDSKSCSAEDAPVLAENPR